MLDDLNTKSPRILSRISPPEAEEVQYWADKPDVSNGLLWGRRWSVGPSADAGERDLEARAASAPRKFRGSVRLRRKVGR